MSKIADSDIERQQAAANTPGPILVIELKGRITPEYATELKAIHERVYSQHGWQSLVLTECDSNRAYGLMPNGGTVEAIDMRLFEQWLKAQGDANSNQDK